MDASYIRLLVEFLSSDSAYFRQNGPASNRTDRLAIALNDPKFGWNLLESIKQDGLELPPIVAHPQLLQAYRYLNGSYDEAMDDAQILMHPENMTTRNALRALLICRDVTLEQIAICLRISLESARVFDQLFYNVRDRLDEPGYIGQLLNPDGVVLGRDSESEELMLLRAGYGGGANEVLQLLSIVPDRIGDTLDKCRDNFEREILVRGGRHALHGGDQNLDSPPVNAAMKLVVADKRTKRDEPVNQDALALETISVGEAIMETVRRITGADDASNWDPTKKPEPDPLTFRQRIERDDATPP